MLELDKKSQIKKNIKNEAGFTLLEILAVIVILGILAVVATPKYFDLQAQAKERAMEASRAEAISRVNQWFAEQVLNGIAPENIDYGDPELEWDEFGDDFTAVLTSGGTGDEDTPIVVTISAVDGGTLDGAADQVVTIPRPGL